MSSIFASPEDTLRTSSVAREATNDPLPVAAAPSPTRFAGTMEPWLTDFGTMIVTSVVESAEGSVIVPVPDFEFELSTNPPERLDASVSDAILDQEGLRLIT